MPGSLQRCFGRILSARRSPTGEVPLPAGHEEIERQVLTALFARILRARLAFVPAGLAVLAWFALADATPWRRAVLAGIGVLVPVLFVAEWLRFRRHGLTRRAVPLNLLAAATAVGALSFASGGLASPFLVALVIFAVLSALFSPRPWHWTVPALELALVWGMWGVAGHHAPYGYYPAVFGNRTSDRHQLAVALAFTFVILVVTSVARLTRAALERAIARSLVAQQESLRAHADRAAELTALSAEIAHELKNPLASVKGLAALLSRDAGTPGPRTSERLAVLRREVDRMQAVLDGFLNFSRPLVPLALGTCDVAALCREVAILHEGMGRERGVEIAAAAGQAPAQCDPRKVKQVLLNLVQNALDASPRGATVTLEAEPSPGGGARVRVLDRGRGLDPELGDAVWRPGVTTKPTGHGLGLTIARALARQHGGDLVLRPREGGGTVAEMSLPGTAGPSPAEGRAA